MRIVSTEATTAPQPVLDQFAVPVRDVVVGGHNLGPLPAAEFRDGIDQHGSRWLQVRTHRVTNQAAIVAAIKASQQPPALESAPGRWRFVSEQPWQKSAAATQAENDANAARDDDATQSKSRRALLRAALGRFDDNTATDEDRNRAIAFILRRILTPDT